MSEKEASCENSSHATLVSAHDCAVEIPARGSASAPHASVCGCGWVGVKVVAHQTRNLNCALTYSTHTHAHAQPFTVHDMTLIPFGNTRPAPQAQQATIHPAAASQADRVPPSAVGPAVDTMREVRVNKKRCTNRQRHMLQAPRRKLTMGSRLSPKDMFKCFSLCVE